MKARVEKWLLGTLYYLSQCDMQVVGEAWLGLACDDHQLTAWMIGYDEDGITYRIWT